MRRSFAEDGLSGKHLNTTASRIRSRMKQLSLTATELARRCDALAHELFGDGERPNITRERISKILMNHQSQIGRGAARIVSKAEIAVLSQVLDVAPEWLSGASASQNPVYWNIFDNPHFARHFAHLLDFHETESGEMFLWGESLLCSLTPPTFYRKFHLNMFSELESIGSIKDRLPFAENANRFVDARRRKLFDDSSETSSSLTQIVFLSELEKIAEAGENYRGITPDVRRSCLENLAEIVSDENNRINLIVACDSSVPDTKKLLRDYDRFGVCGSNFSMWSYHSGDLVWSENPDLVKRHRKILEQLAHQSRFNESSKVKKLLLEICDSISENK